MNIIIGADLVPTQSNFSLFESGKGTELAGQELYTVLERSSFRIFNLETPLTDRLDPIAKEGPNLSAPTAAAHGYGALHVDLLTMANNHIMDQGASGLMSTVKALDDEGIAHVGTGSDLAEAACPFVFEFENHKIGVYACAEHEFSLARSDGPGANPFDPMYSLDHVEKLKSETDFVIVLYHGGKEHFRYPSPDLQKTCRRLVEKGADLVVCQHSHCIGCEEKYQGATIIYGQGNFIFDDSDDECWQTSLLVQIDPDFSISYLPLVKAKNGVRLADQDKGNEIMAAFRKRSEEIKTPGFVEERYAQFAESFLGFYLGALSGKRSILFRILNKLTKGALLKRYFRFTYGAKNQIRIANYIDCEAHRELLSKALEKAYKGKTK